MSICIIFLWRAKCSLQCHFHRKTVSRLSDLNLSTMKWVPFKFGLSFPSKFHSCRVFILLVSFSTFVLSMHMKIECESQEMTHWGLGNLMTCIMSKNTTIHCPGAIVEWNPQVRAISLCMNSEIHFLPSDLHSSFSDLNLIYAYKSAIKAISRENFRNLTKLKTLDLDHNQITEIPRGTFSDLISLRELYMRKSIQLKLQSDFLHLVTQRATDSSSSMPTTFETSNIWSWFILAQTNASVRAFMATEEETASRLKLR